MKTAFGSQAEKPDCQRERSGQSERAQEKGPLFFCCHLPLNQCPERSSWALLPAHSDRKAARREISHQLLRKPQELGERKQALGKAALPTKSSQQKLSGNSSFPVCWFLCLWKATLPQDLFPFLEGSFIKTNSPQTGLEWESGAALPVEQASCAWHCSCTLGNTLGLTGRDFPLLSSRRTRFQSSSAPDRAGQERPHFNVSLEISHLCKCSKTASHVLCELNYHLRTDWNTTPNLIFIAKIFGVEINVISNYSDMKYYYFNLINFLTFFSRKETCIYNLYFISCATPVFW